MESRVDDHMRLVQWFEESENATQDARQKAENDRDYYDGKQWTAAELAELTKRGQPAIYSNYVRRKVDFLRGYERRLRSDPRAYPRTPNEEQGADAATDALRYIADQNDFDEVRSCVYENMLVEGFGGAEVVVEPSRDGYEVVIRHVPWDRIFYDPHSRMPDFSDALYLGMVVWLDKQDALNRWPDAGDVIEATFRSAMMSDTYDDRPKFGIWTDNRRTRVRVVQMHYREGGEWWSCIFTRGGHLSEPQPSPYMDRDGRPACPLILRSTYIDRDNNRYGAVRDMIPLQDEINKRRSKALHLLSVRQIKMEQGAVEDVDAARKELAKPDGLLVVNPNMMLDVLDTGDMAQAQFALLEHATQEMRASGPNAAMAGKDERDLSGRAIQAQQQGGSIEVEPSMDDLRQWSRDVYEAAWLRVRQFWTEARWVRITDDERNIKWVGLNQPVTLADQLGQMPEEERSYQMQAMGLTPDDPRLGQVIDAQNVVSEIDVDIIIEEGPDMVTLQGEQFAQLAELAKVGLPIPPMALIEASSIRNKDKIIEMIEQAQAEQAQQGQMAQQAAMQREGAEIEQIAAKTDKERAETARLTAEALAPPPVYG